MHRQVTMDSILIGKLKILENKNWQWFDEDDDNLTFMEGISISLKMLFNLDFRMKLKDPSSRILIFAGSFMGYLFYAFYTADLTAWMTSNPPPLPIRSVQLSSNAKNLRYSNRLTTDLLLM